MDRYYYLISSLPLLKFAERPSLTKQDFISESEKWLSGQDLGILSKADINNFIKEKGDTSVLRKYKEFEYILREELVFYRTARKKNVEYKIRRDLDQILKEINNPLEIEKQILLLRWNFLEEEELEHFFDLDFLIIYNLKLQILERLFIFDKKKGKERFELFSKVES